MKAADARVVGSGPASDETGLRVLDDRKLKWRLPDDPIADEILIPGLRRADRFDCMVGFFSGQALRQLAPGLAAFISRGRSPIRLLVSPLLTEEDLTAIKAGLALPAEIIANAIDAALSDEIALTDALANHTLQCLAHLLAGDRLEMKVVIVNQGLFHVKEWILHSDHDIAVLSGSANFTSQALTGNVESLHLHRNWRDLDNLDACTESASEFDLLWNDLKPNAQVFDLPSAVTKNLIKIYAKGGPPTEIDFYQARQAEDVEPTSRRVRKNDFSIPSHLNIHSGPFAHQGRAVQAWEENSRRGILAMATGSGKTITALAATKRYQDECKRLLVVIAVPTTPLLTQWSEECSDFGLMPIIAPALAKPKRLRRVQHALTNLDLAITETETVITTNAGLIERDLRTLLSTYDGNALLIADEVHNLGGLIEFTRDPPFWATARLGLSATPIRQYDSDGTQQLYDYFGSVVYQFSLEDAIGVCLVPYDYLLHPVQMTDNESGTYIDLSRRIAQRIARNSGEFDSDDTGLMRLINQRRLILETTSGKLQALEALLDNADEKPIRRALFYATDKDPGQLRAINEILKARRIRAHQITETETGRGRLMNDTLNAFGAGTLHALTAKRVLDEGIDVPQIDTAYILASTTIKKQWIQRRGRVLRLSPKTGKTHAVIHDFVVLPPIDATPDRDAVRLVAGELARCDEFARLARNRAAPDGPYAVINKIRYEHLV